jgi:preprotein translocase subunit SecG
MLHSLLNAFHIIVCLLLMVVILLQQSRGGGLTGSLGGATTQVFGGRGSANFMTRTTTILATLFMALSMLLAYLSSAGDRDMKAFDATQQER